MANYRVTVTEFDDLDMPDSGNTIRDLTMIQVSGYDYVVVETEKLSEPVNRKEMNLYGTVTSDPVHDACMALKTWRVEQDAILPEEEEVENEV